jgi:dephospho-CoA kinase
MKSFSQLLKEEQTKEKHHVLAFGRMNPPTTGHLKLIDKVKSVAHKVGGGHSVIVSHSQDSKKNPLSGEQKVKHLKRYSPGTHFEASSKEKPTILHHAAELHKKGVTHLHVIGGSDRVKEYHDLLHKYNGKKAGHGEYHFKKITVHSAGHRDPDAEGTEGMSASKMREHAKNKDFSSFRQGVPHHVSDTHAKELMHDVRRGMGLHENVNRGMFKAIFVTGGPGSGKDVILREAIAENRAIEINSTQMVDYLGDKQKLAEKTADYRREAVRTRKPLIINGPADKLNEMSWIKEELEELGYDTLMVFVEASNEASKSRNEKLTKMIAESIRQNKWKQAQESKESYQKLFKEFISLNNSGSLEEIEEDITDIYQKINDFIDVKILNEEAYMWLESHGKLNNIINQSFVEEQNYAKKDSRFIQRLKESRGKTSSGVYGKNSGGPKLTTTGGPRADGPGDIPADNRAGDPNGDNIRWNANKRRGSFIFRTYTEAKEGALKVYPEPKESNFKQDKEKIKSKKNRLVDSPTVNQRLRNQSGIGPEFDTRQQGTVYPMSGLGDVTYREEKNFGKFRKTINEYNGFQNDQESGFGGTLGGADNKEPIENPKDKVGYTYDILKRKKAGKK